jgi:putative ABC transport system substrate-binding protein
MGDDLTAACSARKYDSEGCHMLVSKKRGFRRPGATIIVAFLGLNICGALQPTQSHGEPLPVIGYMANKADNPERLRVFQQALAELGYIQGKNITIEFRLAELDSEYAGLAADLAARRVNLILAGVAPAAVAARKATRTIPIVIAQVNDPVGLRLVDSVEHPGTNVTGTANYSSQWIGERLRLLKSFVPALDKVAMVLNGNNANNPPQLALLRSEAQGLGIQVQPLDVRTPPDVGPAFGKALELGTKGLLFGADSFINSQRIPIVSMAAQSKLPAVYNDSEWVVAGGLMSIGPGHLEGYRGAAKYVDLILRGADPGDLQVTVAPPGQFTFSVNRSALAKFGSLPNNLSARVDEWLD